MGLPAYIERQLSPMTIPDSTVEEQLKDLRTLNMTTAQLLKEYPQPDPKLQQKLAKGEMSPAELREMFPPEKRPMRIVIELQSAKLIRAIESERQLQEVMVDFWFNHFNVFSAKGDLRWLITSYERDAIRPHALGKFRDLLLATAKHPAMLYYLDNWMSVRNDFQVARPNAPRGLNENYARELMELHTLGVDGGYTQNDVIEVARCFTGWSIERPFGGGGFVFRAPAHDRGEKRVLGVAIPAGGGEGDGHRVIALLVRQPSTARFIATTLVRRFVADAPPPGLVERVARRFEETQGDIRAMLLTIFTSPEFFSAEAFRAKIKKPLEVVASAVRALDGQLLPPGGDASGGRPAVALLGGGFPLSRQVAALGEPLYEAQPPTGHPDVAEAWVNTGALLGRMNFALGLAGKRFPGMHVDLERILAGADRRRPEQVLEQLLAVILQGQVSPETRAALAAQLDSPAVEKLAALVLGSPEFQRR
jgi:uncharacterized protein (DUF1800 family)